MEKRPPTDADVSANISDSLSKLNQQRQTELNNVKAFQQVRDSIQQLEVKRLTAKYGADHPRVLQIQESLTYHGQMFKALDTEIARANTPTTPLPANGWRIQGKVFDDGGSPTKGITVFLADGNQKWVRQLGSSCTDDGGNYSLTLDEKQIDSLKQQPLFLSASDKKKKNIYSSNNLVTPTKGIADYEDIHLSTDSCVTPPDPPKEQ